LDTKLKNNKQALHTAVVIVLLAAAVFAIIALNYKDKVYDYDMETSSGFEGESFIGLLFQSNYVLYPQVLEKSGKSVREEELYLTFEETELPRQLMSDYIGNEVVYHGSSGQIQAEYTAEIKNNILRNRSLYLTELGLKLDYCVIDEETQTILKNTGREIEKLRDGEKGEYAYYFMVRYDQNGSIYDISVRGKNAEQFLKSAQAVANSTSSLLLENRQRMTDYVLTVDDYVQGKMTITQHNPRNATFIYAMTTEQLENFSWIPVYHENNTVSYYVSANDKELMYDMLGIGRIYLTFLAVITAIFFVLARYVPQKTADTAGTRHSAELFFVILWILFFLFYSLVLQFVTGVNERLFVITIVKFYILAGGMALVFGAWYWCLLSIRGLFREPKLFIRQRSLIYRYWDRILGGIRAVRSKWKTEFVGVDLGKDMTKILKRLVTAQFILVSLMCCCWFFGIFFAFLYSVLLYWGFKRYIGRVQRQYKNLMRATNAIAQGRFDNSFEDDFGIFESYKEELYQIQGGFRTAVEQEVRSQRMKTDLITNVSHDLKTPLTAIITYIDLLKEENVTKEQQKSYLETLERKSLRLKVLIEDLFEISKASSGNVRLEPVAVDICNLIRQVYLEHEDKIAAAGLDMRFDLPEEKVILQLDSQKTYRIFENLYVNVTKYAMPNTRVYVQAKVITAEGDEDRNQEKKIHIELKNISAQELTVNPTDLTERFVRGDASRNTEGSGLGLAIAKSFTELQGGKFGIGIDGDLFKAVLEWQI